MHACRILKTKNAFKTTYNPQTNEMAELLNGTIPAPLRFYIEDHPCDWDLYTPELTYDYNSQPQSSPWNAPFEIVLSRAPGLISTNFPQASFSSPIEFKYKWKQWLLKAITDTQDKLKGAPARYKGKFNKFIGRNNDKINPGDQV